MKKIGIVTLYHGNYNYGGQLQAYAMQKLFEGFGYETKLIAFKNRQVAYFLKRLKDLGLKKSIKSFRDRYQFKKLMKDDELCHEFAIKRKRFDTFIKEIPHTRVYSEKDIKELNDEFDLFVCGSDQIWNPGWWNSILLLSFTSNPKFSYAASIAREKMADKDLKRLEQELKDYIGVSVREEQAQILLEKQLNRKVSLSLDPTLMLDFSEWDNLKKNPDIKEKYVLLYLIKDAGKMKEKIYLSCKEQGYKVYFIGSPGQVYHEDEIRYSDYVIRNAGPREWIGWISNAAAIVTDSFHGSVFSVLFQKEFWCFEGDNPNDSTNRNSRLYSFLKITGLEDRLLTDEGKIKILENGGIDYSNVNSRLMQHRERSFEYIQECIKKAEKNA